MRGEKMKKKEKVKSNVKAGEPLSFYEEQELQIIKNTVTHKGIAHFCCKEMKKACESYDTGKKDRWGKKEHIIADSAIHNRNTNKIGTHTHKHYGYDSYHGHDYYNYVEFKYCPFCGTKINGYVERDKDE